jgi:hypothetical protein
MPEFYGLSEFRAKHDQKEIIKNKLRRTKTIEKGKISSGESAPRLPGLSSSSSCKLDKDLAKEDMDCRTKSESRRKTYLPRINPNTKPSLVKKRNAELTDVKFNPDGMSHSK